jgi:hypothetical protein
VWTWARVDYELDWPAELLGSELRALLYHPHRACTAREVELMLREAFHTNIPAEDYARLSRAGAEWDDDPGPGRPWVNDLLDHLHELRQYTPPRPYWPARRVAPAEPPIRTAATAPQRFAELIGSLKTEGYLDRDFSEGCAYGDEDYFSPGERLAPALEQRLGRPDLWPLQPNSWDTDTFYGLIEVFHDLAARPRSWRYHDDCEGAHATDFDADAGRRVYRALANRLLAENAVELRLAESGEDVGRLVHLADEGRTDLVQRALASPEPVVAGRIRHAIALFRGRDASEHDKRSAIFELAKVLDGRRPLLKSGLLSRDEDALFQIANKFDIRHGREQHSNYDPVFLDWMFWWYLATVELTDRLLARQATQIPAETS